MMLNLLSGSLTMNCRYRMAGIRSNPRHLFKCLFHSQIWHPQHNLRPIGRTVGVVYVISAVHMAHVHGYE